MQEKKMMSPEEIRDFQINRSVKALFKAFLIMLEDLEQEHIRNFDKLYEVFKDRVDIVKQADYLSEQKVSYLRKKVLDAGNDCLRSISNDQ